MVAMPHANSYTIKILGGPTKVSYFSVVNVFPPGDYNDPYGNKHVRIRTTSAAIEAIEANITLFYLDHGQWESLVISD
jgi:hypothetical protein